MLFEYPDIKDDNDFLLHSIYSDELNLIVALLDVEAFKRFTFRWKLYGVLPACLETPADDVLAITIRKLAYNLPDRPLTPIPQEIRDEAKEWLLSRGYDLLMD